MMMSITICRKARLEKNIIEPQKGQQQFQSTELRTNAVRSSDGGKVTRAWGTVHFPKQEMLLPPAGRFRI